jgi:hypothetical protein
MSFQRRKLPNGVIELCIPFEDDILQHKTRFQHKIKKEDLKCYVETLTGLQDQIYHLRTKEAVFICGWPLFMTPWKKYSLLFTILAHEVRIYHLVKRLIEAQMSPPSS